MSKRTMEEIDDEGMLDVIHDWDPPMVREPFKRKVEPEWLKTEKYFRRQRDSKKEIPLRPMGYGKAHT